MFEDLHVRNKGLGIWGLGFAGLRGSGFRVYANNGETVLGTPNP